MLKRFVAAILALLTPYTLTPAAHADTPWGGTVQGPPTGLTITGRTPTSITAAWDPVPDTLRYRLIISPTPTMAAGTTALTADPHTTISGLQPKTVYWVTVAALDPYLAAGPPTTPVQTATASLPTLPAPTVSWASQTRIKTEWAPVGDTCYYQIQISTAASMASPSTITATGHTLTSAGPRQAVAYYVRVRATTATGTNPGPWSKTVKTGLFKASAGKQPSTIKVSGGTAAQRKAVRTYLKKWANHSSINSVTIKRHTDHLGTSWLNLDSGKTTITLRSSLKGKKLRQVVAHEIAHAKTAWIYRHLSINTVQTSLKARFGNAWSLYGPLDAMADCVAQQQTGSKTYLYYKTAGCSKTQLAWAAKAAHGYRV